MLRTAIIILLLLLSPVFVTAGLFATQQHNGTITIDLNKGRIIQLKQPAATLFVADPTIADYHLKAPGIVYIFTKKIGETSLYAVDKDGKIILNYTIKVTHNLSELGRLLKKIIPGSRISLESAADNIVLRGSVNSPAQAEDARHLAEKYSGSQDKVLNFLRVNAPTQINLRVQVIEMTRAVSRALGIDWTAGFKTSNNQFLINPKIIPTDFVRTGINPPNSVNFTGLLQPGNFKFQALINILESKGLVTILSEPNLTALSGETASFLVGGEFPIPVPQGVSGAVTIVFKKFGVSLSFTPTILENRRINLQVRPEVSELSDKGSVTISGFTVPSISTRRAQTAVELQSGQSFAIAGLLQNNSRKLISQLPGLGDLPVLGNLFRSERFQRDETELVIVVTPYIVQPTANGSVVLPTGDINVTERKTLGPTKGENVGFMLN